MRNFEERKAEIFRRSENRIKEQKKMRNSIFALGVSLCLVLLVWFVAKLPAPPITDDNVSSEAVSNFENEENFTINADENEQICKLIETLFENAEDYGGVSPEGETQMGSSTFLPTGSLSYRYKFTLTDENGAVTYILNGLVLTNEATNESIMLTEEQRLQIIDELDSGKGGSK